MNRNLAFLLAVIGAMAIAGPVADANAAERRAQGLGRANAYALNRYPSIYAN